MTGSNCRGRPDEGRPVLICTFYPEINKLEARRHSYCIVLSVACIFKTSFVSKIEKGDVFEKEEECCCSLPMQFKELFFLLIDMFHSLIVFPPVHNISYANGISNCLGKSMRTFS